MYKLHGALGSPYSMKIRALMRYRRLPHIWLHGAATHGSAVSKVKAPVIPVLEYPDGSFLNDSTPLIYDLEARHPGARSVVPEDRGQAFLAHLIEDFADEWLTKAMFGYRWLAEIDQEMVSRWLAFDAFKGGGEAAISAFAHQFRDRQVGRMALVGCNAENFPLIEASTRQVLQALEEHVVNRHCLFGTRPSMAEFALYGQFAQLGNDPTPQAMMLKDFPLTWRWLAHVDDMSGIEGAWDPGVPTVVAKVLDVIGAVYMPFLAANAEALAKGEDAVRLNVLGFDYVQAPFKYQAKCLADIRARHAALDDASRAAIAPALEASGAAKWL